MNYALHLLIYLAIYLIVAVGLNLAVGYCGRLTLAHAAYFGVGAYGYAILTARFSMGFVEAAALSCLLAALLSLLVSLPAWRVKGDDFVMVSLAVQVLSFSLIYNWHELGEPIGTLKNLTNGPYGIMGISRPRVFGVSLEKLASVAALAGILAGLVLLVSWRLGSSPWGRLVQVTRDDELAARGLGKNIRLVKVQVFALACALAALGGALYASYVGYIDPSVGSLDESVLVLCMIIVGGTGNWWGAIVGAVVLLGLPEALRGLKLAEAGAGNVRLLLYGLALVALMHWRPQGLAGSHRLD